jgi:hypothetical protein
MDLREGEWKIVELIHLAQNTVIESRKFLEELSDC